MTQLTLQRFDELRVGDEISPVTFPISQEGINRYAEVSEDFNPLHINEEFARNTPFKGTIAHGLMTLAFVSQVMTKWHWKGWLSGGSLDISFIAPLRPGDEVSIKGRIVEKDDLLRRVIIELDVTNQTGQKIVAGNTEIQL